MMDLPRSSSAAGIARRALRTLLAQADAYELVRDGELALSELIANAVSHTAGEVLLAVWLDRDAGLLRVEVTDEDPRPPGDAAGTGSSGGGRGLKIVDAVTSTWGVEDRRDGAGKTIWFELRQFRPVGRRSA
jgi:anti-sigma regulatory factor (Ser/Thr protein kinase)